MFAWALAARRGKAAPRLKLGRRLPRSFYARPTLVVARELLGKTLVYESAEGTRAVRLVEVEAYLGARDPASHAHRGVTPRNVPMFGMAGHSYVYLVYGMFWCMNVVGASPATPGAVLLRGAEPVAGLALDARALAGPGKLCRALGISGIHTALDLVRGSRLSIRAAPAVPPHQVARTPRIGLNPGATFDRRWRFIVRGSAGVSHQTKARSGSPATSRTGGARAPGPRDRGGRGPRAPGARGEAEAA